MKSNEKWGVWTDFGLNLSVYQENCVSGHVIMRVLQMNFVKIYGSLCTGLPMKFDNNPTEGEIFHVGYM